MKKVILLTFVLFAFTQQIFAQCETPLSLHYNGDYYADMMWGDTSMCYNSPYPDVLGYNTYYNQYLIGGSGSYTYAWYYSIFDNNNNPGVWTLIQGANSFTYQPDVLTQTIIYKRVCRDNNCPSLMLENLSYMIRVNKPDVIQAIQKSCMPINVASVIDNVNDMHWGSNRTIQWESSNSESGPFQAIEGANTSAFTPPSTSSTIYYRRNYGSDIYDATCIRPPSNAVAINPVSCLTYSTTISGAPIITLNQQVEYSVDGQVGMTYFWTVVGGTIISGQGTNMLLVRWDNLSNARTTGASAYSVSVTETDPNKAEPNVLSKEITQSLSTATVSIESLGISLYPNPSNQVITISMPVTGKLVQYSIFTLSGVAVETGSFVSSGATTIPIDIAAGMYQLVLNYDDVFVNTKIVKVN